MVFCDNISTVYMSSNPVQHQLTKHIEIDLHFVRDQVALGHVKVLHVPTSSQYADIFTKGLPSAIFTKFRSSLNVAGNDNLTAWGVLACYICRPYGPWVVYAQACWPLRRPYWGHVDG
jgi:hypothetical protein